MNGITLNVEEQKGVAVMHLGGRVMYDSDAHLFRRELEKLLNAGKQRIIVEMSHVTAMSSTGLGILIFAYHMVLDQGGSCKLARLSEKVRSILTITRLNTIFEIYDSVDDALENSTEKAKKRN